MILLWVFIIIYLLTGFLIGLRDQISQKTKKVGGRFSDNQTDYFNLLLCVLFWPIFLVFLLFLFLCSLVTSFTNIIETKLINRDSYRRSL